MPGRKPLQSSLLTLALAVSLTQGAAHAQEADPGVGKQLTDGALFAQDSCYRLIHSDTETYAECLHVLLSREKKVSPRRLGIEYFGWVGALNSARMGMRGAEARAYEFLKLFRASQRKLKIDDQTLCHSVPGDCRARIARMELMEKGPTPQNGVAHFDTRLSRSLLKLRMESQKSTTSTWGNGGAEESDRLRQ